jgi:hypothetical protein
VNGWRVFAVTLLLGSVFLPIVGVEGNGNLTEALLASISAGVLSLTPSKAKHERENTDE